MEIILILIGVSLTIALVFLVLFLVNVRSGQYDDMHTPSVRILFDNKIKQTTNTSTDGSKSAR